MGKGQRIAGEVMPKNQKPNDLPFGEPPDTMPFGKPPDSSGAVYSDRGDTIDWDESGKLKFVHPSKMSDDDIAIRLMHIAPDRWEEFKKSGRYKMMKARGGLSGMFTDPEGWWGSYIVGKNKNLPTAFMNKGLQSVASGYDRVMGAGKQFVGRGLRSVGVLGPDSKLEEEIMLKANTINQNLNQGRGPGEGGFDPAQITAMGATENAMAPIKAGASIPTMVGANTLGAMVTTPGGNLERLAAGAGAGAGTGLFSVITKPGQIAKKAIGLTQKQQETAARRLKLQDEFNQKAGTKIDMNTGQLTDNPGLLSISRVSEAVPTGTTRGLLKQNEEVHNLFNWYQNLKKNAMNETPFQNEDELIKALMEGGIKDGADPARILKLMEESGGNPNLVAEASRQGTLFGKKQIERELQRDISDIAGNGKVSVDNLLAMIDEIKASGASPRVLQELETIEPKLRAMQVSGPTRIAARNQTGGAEPYRTVVGPHAESVDSVDPFTGVRNERTSNFVGGNRVVSGTANPVDPVMGASRTPANDAGLGISPGSGETVIGPRFSQPDTRYGSVYELAKKFGSLAEAEYPGEPFASKQFGMLNRVSKSELERHAQETGNTQLSLAQRKADEFYRDYIAPLLYSKAAKTAETASSGGQESFLRRNLLGAEDGSQKWFTSATDPKGVAAARSFVADEAMEKASLGGRGGRNAIDNRAAANILENPKIDPIYDTAAQEERSGIGEILRATQRSADVAGSPGADAWGRSHNIWLGLAASPVEYFLLRSKAGRKMLLNKSTRPKWMTPEIAEWIERGETGVAPVSISQSLFGSDEE